MSRIENVRKSLAKMGVATRLASEIMSDMVFVSTGSLRLNEAIGKPGYPCGMITEIYGHESAGKSVLTLIAEANVTRQGFYALHLDAEKNHEHRQTNEWRNVFGINPEFVLQIDAAPAEEMMQAARKAIKGMGPELKLVVVDSVNALVSGDTLEKEVADAEVAKNARLLHRWFDVLRVENKHAAVLCINQLTAAIGRYGGGTAKGGGWAMKFDPHLSLEVKGTPVVKSDTDETGVRILDMTVTVKKNKLAPPRKSVSLVFDSRIGGFDIVREIAKIGVLKGVIDKSGGWYTYRGHKFQGEDKFCDALYASKKMLKCLIKEATGMNPAELGVD